MTMTEAIKTVVVEKYYDFTGRARRSEFWQFILCYWIVDAVLTALGRHIGFFNIISSIVALALLVPSLAVGARRLHDIGKSGWLQLFFFLPIIGWILLIVWWAKDSQPGSNDFGPNPKGM